MLWMSMHWMELEGNFIHIFIHTVKWIHFKSFEMQISVWDSFAPPQIHFQYGKIIFLVCGCVCGKLCMKKKKHSISAFNSGIGWFSQEARYTCWSMFFACKNLIAHNSGQFNNWKYFISYNLKLFCYFHFSET